MTRFIPSYHFAPYSEKLTPKWCEEVVNHCWYNKGNVSLLDGKNINDIEQYSTGDINMIPFKKMFKSIRKVIMSNTANDSAINETLAARADTTGIDWTPLPLIPTKLNAAISAVSKIPVEITCKALDGLAVKNKKEDIEFLKNKAKIEKELQAIAEQLQIGVPDLGTTKHSHAKYSNAPMGLDLNEPDEEDLLSQLIYSLRVETAFEKALQQLYSLKKMANVRIMEITDQYKFGVSAHTAFNSSMTGLPDAEYEYPGNVFTPKSDLPDYGDNPHRVIDKNVTVMEMFNRFSDEIKDEKELNDIINTATTGYCSCNGYSAVQEKDFNTFKISLKHFEVKTLDWIGIATKEKSKRNSQYLTTNEEEASEKIWAQNTYRFWWLTGTKYFFGIEVLPFSYRTKGCESYQSFSSNIYRSQKKSAVELSIGENKKAIVAEIKLQHTILKSLPPGKYIDLRYMRNALEALQEENSVYTLNDLVLLLLESNVFIGDTEGFEGKNDGQLKPFFDIAGGLKGADVTGYLTVIAAASQNISSYTGINEQLTGQGINPEGLVGLQKLLINSGLNALNYCNEAMRSQSQSLFNTWGSNLQSSIEAGGRIKKAIIDMIGMDDTELLDSLNEAPFHKLTIDVQVGQREEERQEYRNEIDRLKKLGIISASDEYVLNGVANTKERFRILAIKEKKFKRDEQKIRQEQFANQQQLIQQQGKNMAAVEEQNAAGKIQQEYAKGDIQSKLLTLSSQLGLNTAQVEAINKRLLQRDRIQGQIEKDIKKAEAKTNSEFQKPL